MKLQKLREDAIYKIILHFSHKYVPGNNLVLKGLVDVVHGGGLVGLEL